MVNFTFLDGFKNRKSRLSTGAGTDVDPFIPDFAQRLRGFKFSQSFVRPSNGTAYVAGYAITNSTSSPSILSQDLATLFPSAIKGGFYVVTNGRVISSGAAVNINCNIVIMPTTFTATNDGVALSIDDTTAANGGQVIPCGNFYNFTANTRCVSDPGWWEGQFAANSTTLYVELQCGAAFTPITGETYTVILEGFLF
jgi:hypothetical protein